MQSELASMYTCHHLEHAPVRLKILDSLGKKELLPSHIPINSVWSEILWRQ